MRTQLKDAAIAGRNDLVVLLVPIGAKPKLPTAAPAASLWKDDFGDSVGDKVLLRGAAGARWLLLRVAKRAELTDENVRCAAANARTTSEKMERAQLTLDLSMLKSRLLRKSFSALRSRADVDSSNTNISGLPTNALASAIDCLCPVDNDCPLSESFDSMPPGIM